jgi:hypothetical protein
MMRITADRSRRIFNDPSPPAEVRENQFDGFDQELKELAGRDWNQIPDNDLWYYFHDLAYTRLQREVFDYLFPVCLNYWYASLMRNEPAEQGDAEFHHALYRGNILDRMVSGHQRHEIYRYFHDGFLDRIEMERGFSCRGQSTPAYAWIGRFNSLGHIAPIIADIWSSWWEFDHPGKAVSAIMYASGLIYLEGENPIFGVWTPDQGGGGPYLAESDAGIFDAGWLGENLTCLKSVLSADYIQNKMQQAATLLSAEPEARIAEQVAKDAMQRADVIQIRTEEMLENLEKSCSGAFMQDWE